jgi:hypothetical protein
MPAFSPVHFTTLASQVKWGGFELGYTEDGCQLIVQPRYEEIFSDDMGGRGGVPSDAQFLGATGMMDLLFTKYNKTYMDNLSCYTVAALTSNAVGLMPALGSFVRQDGLYGMLQLVAPNENLSFATALLRRNYEINSGTRYRRYVLGFELWLNQTDYTQITVAQTRRLYTKS